MSAGTGAAPGQVPPDLPSLLLDARICYIGMPVLTLIFKMFAGGGGRGMGGPWLLGTQQVSPVVTARKVAMGLSCCMMGQLSFTPILCEGLVWAVRDHHEQTRNKLESRQGGIGERRLGPHTTDSTHVPCSVSY